jgi:hypothetical protein
MTVEIPATIERDIQRFAEREHISQEEAVVRLIENGLTIMPVSNSPQTVFEQGLGMFSSPEDSALLDEVVSLAYQERRRPAKRRPTF